MQVDDQAGLTAEVERVMCLRCGFGDVVMSLPALRAWRAAQPEGARVLWLATRPAVDLAEAVLRPGDAVGTYLQLGLKHWGDRGDAEARAAAARWVAALDPGVRFAGLWHAPEGLRDAAGPRFGGTNAQEDPDVEWAAAEAGLGTAAFVSDAAAAGWGLAERPAGVATLEPPPAREEEAEAWLRSVGLGRAERAQETPGRRLLAAAVNGGSELKVWPPERVAEVIAGRPPGVDVVLVAGPDAARAARVQRNLAEALPTLGPVHLLCAAAVLRRCDALLTNDSGLLHLAAAVGTPAVAAFGPTPAAFYMPRVERGGAFAGEAVEAPLGGDGGVPCPLRVPTSLGPPPCVMEERCRWEGTRSCVDAVPVAAVAAALERVLGPV